MSNKFDVSKGKYWQRSLTLVDGCTPCSPGCNHCWAARDSWRMEHHPNPKISDSKKGLVDYVIEPSGDHRYAFNGNIRLREDNLDLPLRTRNPTVFAIWNDLFHEDVPDEFRNKVYSAMDECHHHTFLVLTKRPTIAEYIKRVDMFWYLSNVYHGLTVCNQQEADEKIPFFLQTPGKKFLSIEPCLGEINIGPYLGPTNINTEAVQDPSARCGHHGNLLHGKPCPDCFPPTINAVILGAESGPGARPMKLEWAESIVGQCQAAGVPVFVKQLHINGKLSKNMDEWPENLRVRELPWR